ncbi:hypothetical protein GCM10007857_66850 [Bradyrhizobium iriomotense]|uniref:Uncharacterized protein n=1 Tax=Bradyrhizobium iriomotense TaxID=441950 RepID=A0ABQ6B924_9BRAD|nr:hypothetical protein GCM10007857_66850 [Bradyrhizobium iriomotense]
MDTFGAIAAGESQSDVLMINSKEAHAKFAVRKYRIVCPRTDIDANQQTRGLYANRGNRTHR